DRVSPEPPVLGHVVRKLVVVAEEDGFSVAPQDQLGRDGSVERPHLHSALVREVRVEARGDGRQWIDAGIQTRRDPWVIAGVDLRPLLGALHGHARREYVEPLVSPIGPRGPALDGTKSAA